MPINTLEKENILALTKHNKIKASEGWKNFAKNIVLANSIVLDIDDAASLQALVKTVYDLNQKKEPRDRILLRVAAGGRHAEYSQSYSFTPGSEADVIIRLTGDEFKQITPVPEKKNMMSVGASVQIGELDKELYEKHNLSLPTSSLIPYVTVAGLASNAGHGTGKDQPSFAGLIRAMTLCLPDGKIVRIDGTHKNFETIRAAHLGLFGIVLDVELKCTEAKKIQCVMEARTVAEFLAEVNNGVFYADPYVSVMYVPTYQKNELTSNEFKNVIIYRWKPVEKTVNDLNNHPMLSHIGQELEIKLEEGFHIIDLLRQFPSLIPYYMRYLVSRIEVGTKDSMSVGPLYTMHYQTAFPWDIDDADYLFEVNKDNMQIATVFKQIVKNLTDFTNNKQYPLIDAVYMRLISGTNGGLSTSQHGTGMEICGLDMVSSARISGYDKFKMQMERFFIKGIPQAKPHWGKYVPANIDYAKIYGNNFRQYVNALNNWYQEHGLKLENSMLLNSFLCQILQLPYAPAVIKQPDLNKHAVFPLNSGSEIAAKLCEAIEDDDVHAVNFKKRLQAIAAHNDLTKCSFFQPVSVERRENVAEREKRDNRSGVLLYKFILLRTNILRKKQ